MDTHAHYEVVVSRNTARGFNMFRADDRDKLIESLRQAQSPGGAALLCGVSESTIFRMRKRFGVTPEEWRGGPVVISIERPLTFEEWQSKRREETIDALYRSQKEAEILRRLVGKIKNGKG